MFRGLLIAIVLFGASLSAYAQCNGLGSGEDSIQALKNYNLYRDAFKMKNYEEAVKFWRPIFNTNPGYRLTPFQNGEAMYKKFIKDAKKAKNTELYNALIDTLMMVYDKRIECHGDEGAVLNRKAVAQYQFRSKGVENVKTCLATFNKAFDLTGDKMTSSALQYYFKAAVKATKQDALTKDDALKIYLKVAKVIDGNLANASLSAKKKTAFSKAKDGVESQLGKVIESCEDAKAIFGPEYEKRKDDPKLWDLMYKVYVAQGADCMKEPVFIEIAEKIFQVDSAADKAFFLARNYADIDKSKAVDFYKVAVAKQEDSEKKAKYLMDFASFYKDKGDFVSARNQANEAAKIKEGWGEPYYFIGILYASSGSRCGKGTGWDSQVVTWVAVDMFVKAKNVDASYAEKANKLINKYKANYPLKSDAFMKQLDAGANYFVPCWIQRNTKVRFTS